MQVVHEVARLSEDELLVLADQLDFMFPQIERDLVQMGILPSMLALAARYHMNMNMALYYVCCVHRLLEMTAISVNTTVTHRIVYQHKYAVHYTLRGHYLPAREHYIHIHANSAAEARWCVRQDGVGYNQGTVYPHRITNVEDVTPPSWNRVFKNEA